MHSILRWVKGFLKKNTEDHLGAYASQAAFFIVLSAFPFCIFLLTLHAVFTVEPMKIC